LCENHAFRFEFADEGLRFVGVAFRIVRDLRLTIVVFDGEVSAPEWLEAAREVYAHPDWSPGPLNLTDASTADISTLTPDDRVKILGANGLQVELLEGMKSAVVAGPNFESSQAFTGTNPDRGLQMIVFTDLDLACAWLNVDVERVRPIISDLRATVRQRR
jgi:hypothetical protein